MRDPDEAWREMVALGQEIEQGADVTSCRWCLQEIVPCTAMPVPVCKGWKHVQFMDTMPVGAHYCGGRSVYPSAEPETRPASMLRKVDISSDDDPAELERVPVRPVTEAEEAQDVW